MQEILNQIIKKEIEQFDSIKSVKKINVGFTNTIYLLNDKYYLKICSNFDNEKKFKNEISFYLENKDNDYIPKLLRYSIEKHEIPYLYEIIEKVPGSSLYNIWHTLTETQRKEFTKQICELMKKFHSNKKPQYNWCDYIDNQILCHLKKLKQIHYFNEEELELINQARQLFHIFLASDDFVFVHNDIHFDNIIANKGKIKVIDFERSIIAPIDFELSIFFRMVRNPWKYATEEIEQYTNIDDYSMIPNYVREFYPEILNVKYLEPRLAIYDILDSIEKSYEHPTDLELKNIIINAAKTVINSNIITLKDATTLNKSQ